MVKPIGKIKKDLTTEQRILEAARKVFQQQGMSGARMQDIADAAGINKALLHYYFRSKETLFGMIFAEAMEQFMVSIAEILGQDADLEIKIAQICQRYMDTLLVNPYLPMFVMSEINRDPNRIIRLFKNRMAHWPIEHFLKQIQEAVNGGKIRSVRPEQLLVHIISMCVFPFAAKPMLMTVLQLDEQDFDRFIDVRKRELPLFILAALKSDSGLLPQNLDLPQHPKETNLHSKDNRS